VIDLQETIDDAWDHLDAGEADIAANLARQVLETEPDAVDAYVVLARTRGVAAEAIALLRAAVLIGDRAGAAAKAAEDAGEFPYDRSAHVRAIGNLARLLWSDGRTHQRSEALKHARRAFRLDPDDRAGTRLLLMAWEASVGNWPQARRVARRCRDEFRTEVRYWLALHAFRDGADDADALRARAVRTNPYVVAALEGRLLALHLPEGSYGLGSPDEAALYAADAREGWQSTPGALAWLAAATRVNDGE
jgi:tetratricopeptide (TPR) repeat protein